MCNSLYYNYYYISVVKIMNILRRILYYQSQENKIINLNKCPLGFSYFSSFILRVKNSFCATIGKYNNIHFEVYYKYLRIRVSH